MRHNKNTVLNFWSHLGAPTTARNPFLDPDIFISSMSEAFQGIIRDPKKYKEMHFSLQQYTNELNRYILERMQGRNGTPPVTLPVRDKRFAHEQWDVNVFFDIIKQAYLVFSEWFDKTLNDDSLELDPETKRKIRFYTQQIIHAMSPNNFAFLNPLVIEEAYKTSGASVVKGLMTMMDDLQKGKDPDMTDMSHFQIGENIATCEGAVVFRNDLIELIQYKATTEEVFKKPLLIVPPWINKYYVFDLSKEKSMIRWLLEQGRTVFVVSWVNPNTDHRHKTLESYVLEGPKAAIEVIRNITQVDSVDTMGYCLGGTLLACLAAHFAALNKTDIASLTLLTTLTDFSDAGDLTTFMSEDYVRRIEKLMDEEGYLSGKIMARTFNMLRPSELVWSYVVNNYYLGKDPVPFDFLYWNSDNTNMPEAMHSNLLRFLYQENRLAQPGKYIIDGEGIDLSKITLPVYMMSAKEDHIAPWKTTYKGVFLMKNADITFVLGGSGHVAGVINPPSKQKYGYWTRKTLDISSDQWMDAAEENVGSWWLHWHEWLVALEDQKTLARKLGSETYPSLCKAPGLYVLKSCE